MPLPAAFLQSLWDAPGFDRAAFERAHEPGLQLTSIRVNPAKHFDLTLPRLGISRRINWTEYGYYLAGRPSFTFDPLFHAGCYYVQEASSMFLEQALRQSVDLSNDIRVLDLCAAPGGKSTHIQSLVTPGSLVVSNEVIKSRAQVLKDNIIKWGYSNAVVTNNDPKDFRRVENFFDVIVVDAPCSGSGLLRRDPSAIEEWSENNVTLCSQRQQRILADILPALKKGGLLVYSTCSYSRQEDEDILDWLATNFSLANLRLQVQHFPGIVEVKGRSGGFGYRFWPDKIDGEGFFITCFRKNDGEEDGGARSRPNKSSLSKADRQLLNNWFAGPGFEFIKHDNTVYAWPGPLANWMEGLLSRLRVIYSGTRVGDLIRDKLVPDHALAMSALVHRSIPRIDMDEEQAIQYLQRKDIRIAEGGKGWHLACFKEQPLGWMNLLQGRINNYYPKELRILKESK
jgi:16S rRNA C967 or C1407 C5-methylase (RsmB/RsmF family)/NOL1/NOP2/fmu family ribosome biogenesis protein